MSREVNTEKVLVERVLVAGTLVLFACSTDSRARDAEPPAAVLQSTLASAGASLRVDGERIHAARAVPRFYRQRTHRLAWIGADGCPSRAAARLARFISAVEDHGLRPGDYHLEAINRRHQQATSAGCDQGQWPEADAAALDLLLTDAFLLLASHMAGGRLDPNSLDPEWQVSRRAGDPVKLLKEALVSGEVSKALASLAPPAPQYMALSEALARYRGLAWPSIGAGDDLRVGQRGERVTRLRRRLQAEGLMAGGQGEAFDKALEAAVRRAQAHLGLPQTGVVDDATRRELDRTPAERARQIEANMERWRWLPDDLGRRHVVVRVPAFELAVVEGGRDVLTMRAVVGKPHRRTPMLSSTLRSVVINPAWQVPRRIAVKDIIPEVRKDPGYLGKHGITLYAGWDPAAPVVDPSTVDWKRATLKNFKLRMRQRPGADNALGRLKFLFPNRYDVYLHDTPKRHLFARQQRTFSSGCIRLERPLDLADALLRGEKGWTRERIQKAYGGGELSVVVPGGGVPVHLTYFTAWVDAAGAVHFRPDVYGRDRGLLAALERPAPGARSEAGR